MTLLIRETDVASLLPMSEAIPVVREALSQSGEKKPENLSRRRLPLAGGILNVMAASVPANRSAGVKAYSVSKRGARFLVGLWDWEDGRLLALIEADLMGRIRTGAASGVATDLLAPTSASRLAVIGTGKQAFTQVEAVASVRSLREVVVYSRDSARRHTFARNMEQRLGLKSEAAASAPEAVDGADVVVTITTAKDPVLQGQWLGTNCHVNAAGANHISRRELAGSVLARATVVCVDSIAQAHLESGDLAIAAEEGARPWDHVVELGALLANAAGPRYGGITVFKSLGVAVEDVAVARHVYEQALIQGAGEPTTFGEGSE